jgi:hypothetical protein
MRRRRPKATTRLGEHVEGSVRLPRKNPGGRTTYALARSPLKEHGQEEGRINRWKSLLKKLVERRQQESKRKEVAMESRDGRRWR